MARNYLGKTKHVLSITKIITCATAECKLDMLDKSFKSILLDGSDIWGFDNLFILVWILLRFICVSSRLLVMLFMDNFKDIPYCIAVLRRVLKLCCRLIIGNENKNSTFLCRLLLANCINYGIKRRWLTAIKSILMTCAMRKVSRQK